MMRFTDFPEIPEDIVGALLQLKHIRVFTLGAVIFVHALLLLLKFISEI